MRKSISILSKIISIPIFISSLNCGFTNVLYRENIISGEINAKVITLGSQGLNELVLSMQTGQDPISESFFKINWIPMSTILEDYNHDGKIDINVVSETGENHIFYQNENGFYENNP